MLYHATAHKIYPPINDSIIKASVQLLKCYLMIRVTRTIGKITSNSEVCCSASAWLGPSCTKSKRASIIRWDTRSSELHPTIGHPGMLILLRLFRFECCLLKYVSMATQMALRLSSSYVAHRVHWLLDHSVIVHFAAVFEVLP